MSVMKAMAILFRVVFSIIVLVLLACYLQMSPTITVGEFVDSLNTAGLAEMFTSVNTVTVSIFLVILLGIFSFTRILEALWNVLFCASIILLLAGGLYVLGGASIALPNAIFHNDFINSICAAIPAYQVPIAIVTLIFLAGWICASACGRIAITAVVSYGLWYGLTEFFSYVVYLWSNSDDPSMPEALNMIQGTPWIIAAVPAAFFLIYALLMAFFETFITNKPAKTAKPAKEDAPKAEEAPAKEEPAKAEAKTEEKKPVEPAAKSQPILKTTAAAPVRKLKVGTPAAEKPKAEPAPEKKEEEKPAAVVEEKAKEEEPKAEETPAKEEPAKEESPKEEKKEETHTPAEAPKAEA